MNRKLNLEIACWNVNGLINKEGNKSVCKLSIKDFTDTFCKYDIVCLLETKVEPSVNLKFDENFTEKALYRKKKKICKGILWWAGVIHKHSTWGGITFIPSTSS